jgi:hypothetical protein
VRLTNGTLCNLLPVGGTVALMPVMSSGHYAKIHFFFLFHGHNL